MQVTANARTEQIAMAKEAGMVCNAHIVIFHPISDYTLQDDVVTKPFRIPDLIPQMHDLIEKTSA